jgi:hypothetical protein
MKLTRQVVPTLNSVISSDFSARTQRFLKREARISWLLLLSMTSLSIQFISKALITFVCRSLACSLPRSHILLTSGWKREKKKDFSDLPHLSEDQG